MKYEKSVDFQKYIQSILKQAGKDFKVKPLIEAMTVYSGQGITAIAAPLETNTDIIIGDFLWKEPSAIVYLDIPLYKEQYPRDFYKVVADESLEKAHFLNSHGETVFTTTMNILGTPTTPQAAAPHSDTTRSSIEFCLKFCWPVCCWGIRCVEYCISFTTTTSTNIP